MIEIFLMPVRGVMGMWFSNWKVYTPGSLMVISLLMGNEPKKSETVMLSGGTIIPIRGMKSR